MKGTQLGVILAMALCAPASAQSFSCTIGRPACLDYGAVVCDSMAKCVASDAVCFRRNTCDYQGFACKSDLDEAVEEIRSKVNAYNTLVADFNNLRDEYQSLLQSKEQAERTISDMKYCIDRASSLEEAQACQF